MLLTIIVSVVSCLAVMLLVLIKPALSIHGKKINIYWFPALIGSIILIASGSVSFKFVLDGLTEDSAVNPIKILVLFISMTLLSVYLDEVGFFRYAATFVLKHSGHGKLSFFTLLYFTVAFLTIVTSNDIIILTFSPFICYFAKHAKINPIPYLFAEFVSANTWSMLLIIGNPTNIFLATSANISFTEYTKIMALPTVIAGIVNYLVLLAVFGKKLSAPSSNDLAVIHIDYKPGLIIGLIHLFGCTALLIVASYIKLEMWYICLAFCCSLFICILIHKLIHKQMPKELLRCLKRAPWELIPFILSMFIIILFLKENGITDKISVLLTSDFPILTYGITSFLSANLINNIPMSVLFGSITASCPQTVFLESIFATVIGSNIGAFLTPVGALAGIMWNGILSHHNIKFGFGKFILYGFIIAVPTLLAALGGLYLSFLII